MQIRCPYCQTPNAVESDGPLRDIQCAGCDSSYSLAIEETVDHRPAEVEGGDLGARMFAHFRLVKKLGFGSFGTVWKAEDTQLHRTVAVKIPRKNELSADEAEYFLREARAAAQLKHPHIVSVHEVGRHGDSLFMVSDFIDGGTLSQWIAGRQLTPREAAAMCATLADALQHAHEAGVVHRDLKPTNIMVAADGAPYVMDFGLAKRDAGEVTMTIEGNVLGTPAYMSPEQARGDAHQADCRSDIYALGVILFELMTGELPFRGNVRMVLRQVVEDEPPSPRKLNGQIPRDLETICLKCLQKDPSRRYQTAEQLVADLQRYLHHEPIRARPVSGAERVARWCVRNRVVASLLFAVLLALVAGMSTSTYLYIQERAQAKLAEDNFELANLNAADAQAEARNARRRYYAATINLAQQALNDGHVDRALAWLKSLMPAEGQEDLRGFEWYYLLDRCQDSLIAIRAHPGGANTAAFTPDSRTLVTGGNDCAVRVYSAETGVLLRTLYGHTGLIDEVAVSPDGESIASASFDGTVKRWRLSTGELLATYGGHTAPLHAVEFSPDRRYLITATAEVNNLGELKVWETATGREIARLQGHKPGNANHVWGVSGAEFSRDGRLLATSGFDGRVILWDTSDWSLAANMRGHTGWVRCVAFSHDGKRIASGGDDERVILWDVEKRQVEQTISPHGDVVYDVDFSSDDASLVIGTVQGAMTWDIASSQPRGLGHMSTVLGAAFSPDEAHIATAGADGRVMIWSADRGAQSQEYGDHAGLVESAAFSPDGKLLASAADDRTIILRDTRSGEVVGRLNGHKGYVIDVAFAPAGDTLASASYDGTVRLWSVAEHFERATLGGGEWGVNCVAYSGDGKLLASGDWSGKVKLWDAAKRQLIGELSADFPVQDVAFAADGRTVIGAAAAEYMFNLPGQLAAWDIESGRRQTLFAESGVLALALSPDGKTLAFGGTDAAVRLWDFEQAQVRAVLRGHTQLITALAYSPDGRTLASASEDQSIVLWSTAVDQKLLTLRAQQLGVYGVAFTPQGDWLVSAHGDAMNPSRAGVVNGWQAAAKADGDFASDEAASNDVMREDLQRRLRGYLLMLRNGSSDPSRWRPAIRELEQRLVNLFPEEPHYKAELAGTLQSQAGDAAQQEQFAEAIEMLRQAIAMQQQAVEADPVNPIYRSNLASQFEALAELHLRHDDQPAAANDMQQSGRIREQLADEFPQAPVHESHLAANLQLQAHALKREDRFDESLATLRRAIEHQQAALAINPDWPLFRRRLRNHRRELLDVLWRSNDRGQLAEVAAQLVDDIVDEAADCYEASAAFAAASETEEEAEPSPPVDPQQHARQAVDLLKRSIAAGFADYEKLSEDRRFDPVRDQRAFQRVADLIAPSGQLLGPLALVRRPAPLDNVVGWTIETRAHRGETWAVARRPGKPQIATAGSDGVIRIWDTPDMQFKQALVGQQGCILSLDWSPDGEKLAACGREKTVRVWDVDKGRVLHELTQHDNHVQSVDWSKDGRRIVTAGSDRTLRLWDPQSGAAVGVIKTGEDAITAMAADPQAELIATAASDNVVRLWDTRSGAQHGELRGHTRRVSDLLWIDNGRTLVSCGEDQSIRIWNVEDKKQTAVLEGHKALVRKLAFDEQSGRLASCGFDGFVRVWDPSTGAELRAVRVGQTPNALDWTNEGQLLCGTYQSTLHLASPDDELPPTATGPAAEPIVSLAWSPDGRHLASAGQDGWVHIWDLATGRHVRKFAAHARQLWSLEYSPDGKTLAIAAFDPAVLLFNAETGEPTAQLEGHQRWPRSLAWSRDGAMLASGDQEGIVAVWDVPDGKLAHMAAMQDREVRALAFSGDGTMLYCGGQDGSIGRLDTRSGEQELMPCDQNAAVYSLACSADGGLLAAGLSNAQVAVWKLDGWEQRSSFYARCGLVRDIAWLGGEQLLACGDEVRRWGADGGEPLRTFANCSTHLNALCTSPDGRYAAAAGREGVIQVWDTLTGHTCAILVQRVEGVGMTLGPRGDSWHQPPAADDLAVVVADESGQQTLTWQEFAERHSLSNAASNIAPID